MSLLAVQKRAMIDDIYDLVGGKRAIWAATESFYKKVLAHKDLRHFFEGTDGKLTCPAKHAHLRVSFAANLLSDGVRFCRKLTFRLGQKYRASNLSGYSTFVPSGFGRFLVRT